MPTGPLHTPSLRVRLIAIFMIMWVVLVVSLDVFLFVSLRRQLLNSLDDLLATRAALAQELGATLSPELLGERLTELGVPAVVQAPDGRVLAADPAAPGFGPGPPGPATDRLSNPVSRTVEVPGGVTVMVFASRTGVERTLDQVLIFETIGSIGVLLLMLALLLRMSRVLLDPIDHVVATAQHIAAGDLGERLRPDRPDTELGRLALAFDEMLDTLEDAVDTAQRAEREAREAEVASRRFLADAAHQLRTPIAGLRASVESLMLAENPEGQHHILDNLARESARTGRLVASLLRVAALDRGDALDIDQVDLVVIAGEEVLRARTFSPQLTIVFAPGGTPLGIAADADAIRDALSNILDNARRHAAANVVVRCSASAGYAEVRVDDDGPGLPDGAETSAFERFTTFDGHGGSGLGLAIARGIARAHGGDLTYENGGFFLRVPLSDVIEPSAITSSDEARPTGVQ